MNVSYAILCYSTSIVDDAGPDLAMVTMGYEVDGGTKRLRLTTLPNWKGLVGREDVDYIAEVFDDVQQIQPEERAEAFQRLSEMSAGKLRTRLAGQCSESELGSVLQGSLLAQAS